VHDDTNLGTPRPGSNNACVRGKSGRYMSRRNQAQKRLQLVLNILRPGGRQRVRYSSPSFWPRRRKLWVQRHSTLTQAPRLDVCLLHALGTVFQLVQETVLGCKSIRGRATKISLHSLREFDLQCCHDFLRHLILQRENVL
jgi:hypothetical protein